MCGVIAGMDMQHTVDICVRGVCVVAFCLTPENIDNPEITLNYNNLELLCRQCHAEVHDKRKKCRRFTIGPDGEIIIETSTE